jgi:hypothetical protein
MSLEKKRRSIGNLERSVILALHQDPFVALDDKLIESGLIPDQGDPRTGGWGRTNQGPTALRQRAAQVAELAEQGVAAAHAFRTGDASYETASADMQSAISAIDAPFEGFKRTSFKDPGSEPHTSVRDRKWTFEGDLVLSMRDKGKWVQIAKYRPDPSALGVPAKILSALAAYEAAWRQRDEQTATLEGLLDKATGAWKVHPAKKVADEYVIALDSPAARQLQRATKALTRAQKIMSDWKSAGQAESFGWRRSPGSAMFTDSASFAEARDGMDKALSDLRAKVPANLLSVGGQGELPAKGAAGDPEQQMEVYARASTIDTILGQIELLYRNHPVRRRFDKIVEATIAGDVPLQVEVSEQSLDDRVQTLEDLDVTSGVIAHDFTEGRLDFPQTKLRLEQIRNELAAIDGSFDPRSSGEPIDQICAEIMARPPRFTKQEHRPIRIDDHRALAAMTTIEGDAWLASQMRDRREPTGYLANRDAWRVLRDLGPDAKGLDVGDLLEGGGTIHGNDGRLYEVRPDGRIALLATSSDDQAAEAAEKFGLLVT